MTKGAAVPQEKQIEWIEEWEMFECDDLFLFGDWIYPNSLLIFVERIFWNAVAEADNIPTLWRPSQKA